MSRRVARPPAWLYRLHTPSGQLAYVGVTTRLVSDAVRDHRHRSRWWPSIDAGLTVAAGYASASEAEADQALMIAAERPLFNVHRAPAVRYVDQDGSPLASTPPRSGGRTAAAAIPGAPGGEFTPQSVSGATAAERVARRGMIRDRANDAVPRPAERQPGEYRVGDRVRWANPFMAGDTIDGRMIRADVADHSYFVRFDKGGEQDVDPSELTMLERVEDRQS